MLLLLKVPYYHHPTLSSNGNGLVMEKYKNIVDVNMKTWAWQRCQVSDMNQGNDFRKSGVWRNKRTRMHSSRMRPVRTPGRPGSHVPARQCISTLLRQYYRAPHYSIAGGNKINEIKSVTNLRLKCSFEMWRNQYKWISRQRIFGYPLLGLQASVLGSHIAATGQLRVDDLFYVHCEFPDPKHCFNHY